MADKGNRSVYLRAFEHGAYWTIKIAVDEQDDSGTTSEPLTLRESTRAPKTDDPVDQAWVLLVTALHVLERHGAMGRISGADWPALDFE